MALATGNAWQLLPNVAAEQGGHPGAIWEITGNTGCEMGPLLLEVWAVRHTVYLSDGSGLPLCLLSMGICNRTLSCIERNKHVFPWLKRVQRWRPACQTAVATRPAQGGHSGWGPWHTSGSSAHHSQPLTSFWNVFLRELGHSEVKGPKTYMVAIGGKINVHRCQRPRWKFQL